MKNIAVLLTCYNRKDKTVSCLKSLFSAQIPLGYNFEVFLVDDGSSDGTANEVERIFPEVNIIKGNGNLFWNGGMRLAWETAIKARDFDFYLLLNDDTILYPKALNLLIEAHNFSVKKYKKEGIYVGSTIDPISREFTYGGHKLLSKFSFKSIPVIPQDGHFHYCDFANGNILMISASVVQYIGILSEKFTHSISDYDYSLKAKKKGIPLLVCPEYCGTCIDDHGKNWLSNDFSLAERIKYLKSPKYLAYKEYLFFIKFHFPFYYPLALLKLWAKTFIPIIWDKFKKRNY